MTLLPCVTALCAQWLMSEDLALLATEVGVYHTMLQGAKWRQQLSMKSISSLAEAPIESKDILMGVAPEKMTI